MVVQIDLLGRAGWARVDLADPDAIHVGTRTGAIERRTVPAADPTRGLGAVTAQEMVDFVQVVRRVPGTRPDLPTVADGHAAQLVIDAAGVAAATLGWVPVG
jgi:predicted dehydrogenase